MWIPDHFIVSLIDQSFFGAKRIKIMMDGNDSANQMWHLNFQDDIE